MSDEFSLRRRNPEGDTPVLKSWGIDSETGVLRDVLVGPIANFTTLLPTNAINRAKIRAGAMLDIAGARSQYEEVISILGDSGAEVHITSADPDLPLQIWGRDASFMTPWGMIIGQMAQWWRRGEYGPVLDFCSDNDLPLYDKITAGCLEGGDFMILKPGAVLIGYSGERSNEAGAVQAKRWLNGEGWDVRTFEFDPFFVHADVIVAMITNSLAGVCTDVCPPGVVDWIRQQGIEVMDVPYKHANALGLNVMALGKDRALIPKNAVFLAEQCRARGVEVFDPDVSCITVAGGGIHCMCQPLRRDPV